MRQAGFAVLTFLLAAGCGRPTPKAPALRDEPVYTNSRDGMSFLSPTGWMQKAKSDPPDEISEKDRLLVSYQSPPGASPAWFELSRADIPESTDLLERLSQPSHASGSAWLPAGKPEAVTVGGVEGIRYIFTNQERIKETTTVRRGQHLYFFTITSDKSDEQARRQIRQIVADARWVK